MNLKGCKGICVLSFLLFIALIFVCIYNINILHNLIIRVGGYVAKVLLFADCAVPCFLYCEK